MTVSSDVEICNLALLRLGTNPITSLTDDGTTASNACLLVYDSTKKSLLRRHFWNFSMQRAALAADVTTPAFEFSYQYTLPSDFLRLKEIEQQSSSYSIESGKLLTNQSAPLNIIYVGDVEDVTRFDSLFVEALVLMIVVKIGPRIQGDGFNPAPFVQELQQVLLEAKMVDAQDSSPDQLKIDTFTKSRYGYTDGVVGGMSWFDYY